MGRKSFKVGKWHHTETNRRNVQNNRGPRYWENKQIKAFMKKRKQKRQAMNKVLNSFGENVMIVLIIIAFLLGLCYFN